MSLATSEPQKPKFLNRFEHVWASLRRYQVRQGLGWSFLAAALGLAVLVAADYRLELPWNTAGGRSPRLDGRDAGGPLGSGHLAVAVVDQATNRRRDREPFPAARPAHPDRRPVRRAFRGTDPLRRA